MGVSQRDGDAKSAAAARRTADADLSAVQADQILNQRQADTATFMGSPVGALDSVKTLEQMGQRSSRRYQTGVADAKTRIAVIL